MVTLKSSKIEMGLQWRCWLHCATLASLSFSLFLALSQARQPNVCHHILWWLFLGFSLELGQSIIPHVSIAAAATVGHRHIAPRAPPPPSCCPSWLVGRSVPWCTWYSIHFSPSVIMCVTWFSSTALYTGRIRGSGLSQMPWHHF